jgi:hypothetical protein
MHPTDHFLSGLAHIVLVKGSSAQSRLVKCALGLERQMNALTKLYSMNPLQVNTLVPQLSTYVDENICRGIDYAHYASQSLIFTAPSCSITAVPARPACKYVRDVKCFLSLCRTFCVTSRPQLHAPSPTGSCWRSACRSSECSSVLSRSH